MKSEKGMNKKEIYRLRREGRIRGAEVDTVALFVLESKGTCVLYRLIIDPHRLGWPFLNKNHNLYSIAMYISPYVFILRICVDSNIKKL